MSVGLIKELWRYPVKSLGGKVIAGDDVGIRCIPGDRAWALRDEIRGGMRGAKKIPGLMNFAARHLSEPPFDGSGQAEIVMPDGAIVITGDREIHKRLSDTDSSIPFLELSWRARSQNR